MQSVSLTASFDFFKVFFFVFTFFITPHLFFRNPFTPQDVFHDSKQPQSKTPEIEGILAFLENKLWSYSPRKRFQGWVLFQTAEVKTLFLPIFTL